MAFISSNNQREHQTQDQSPTGQSRPFRHLPTEWASRFTARCPDPADRTPPLSPLLCTLLQQGSHSSESAACTSSSKKRAKLSPIKTRTGKGRTLYQHYQRVKRKKIIIFRLNFAVTYDPRFTSRRNLFIISSTVKMLQERSSTVSFTLS